MLTLLRLSAAMVELCHDFIFLENDRPLAGQSAPSHFRKKYSIFFFSETVRRMKLKIGILALDIALYKSYDYFSGQIRTLVAMATYCFHRLITWKFLLFQCG